MNPALDEEEWEEEIDERKDDSDDLLFCPTCRKPVHEDTQKCPHCGDWITPAERPGSGKRLLFVLAVVLMIGLMLIVTVL